jgi:hypothetical protein
MRGTTGGRVRWANTAVKGNQIRRQEIKEKAKTIPIPHELACGELQGKTGVGTKSERQVKLVKQIVEEKS